jgi:dihydroorotate dehydrogenase electron transfer subunit
VRTLLQGPLGRAPQKIVLILAGRRDDEIYIQDVVRRSGVTIVETTDDGSRGEKGFATDALRRRLSSLGPIEAYACGPTPMLRAVKALAAEAGFRAWLSVEEPMACGFGVCNACVVRREGADLRYAKACQEGPVFDAAEIRP